jgi:hypothetical protein
MQRIDDIAGYHLGAPRCNFDNYVNNFLFLPAQEPGFKIERLDRALREPDSILSGLQQWMNVPPRKAAG